MAYFLKKTHRKKGLYLQIYFSYRDPVTKQPKNRSHRAVGYESDLIESGIDNPVEFFQREVDALNQEFRASKPDRKTKKIGSISPARSLGHFPAAAIMNRLDIKEDIDLFASSRQFQFSVYDCLCFLIYARLIHPASKRKTSAQVIPTIWNAPEFSYDQILSCLEFVGNNYERFIEIFSRHVGETYVLDFSKAFFDCTNFYFEIDQEDDWRRKGPSKEGRKDPILGMGLLLDKSCIPVAMKLYPGNQSEKPVLRETLSQLRRQHRLNGRIVQVADKGLNCAQNIYEAISRNDGYIFSKSIKMLSQAERNWALKDEGFVTVADADHQEDFRMKSCIDQYSYAFTDENGRKYEFTVREKRIVTFNPSLARKQRMEIQKMVEKAKGCTLCHAKKIEYGESARYVIFTSVDKETGEIGEKKVTGLLDEKKIRKDLDCAGYNMIVTSEYEMNDKEIYDTYHELWRIEESFRTMKSELDARPVYLQTIERIKGHFLVCYLSVLLERLFQFKVLENRFSSHAVYEFIKGFKVVANTSQDYINLSQASDLINFMAAKYNLPIDNAFLTKREIKRILERSL